MEQPCYTWDPCDKIIEELLHALKYKYKGFLLKIYLKNHELKVDGNADQGISTPIPLPCYSNIRYTIRKHKISKKEGFIIPHIFLQNSWGFLPNPRTEYWLMCQPIFAVLWGYITEDWSESWGFPDRTSPGMEENVMNHMILEHVL